MSFQSGDILLGKYRIDRFIAAGKFAEVYQATHLKLNAVYALKVLRRDGPGLGSSDYGRWVERFRQEATLGAGLKSPYIVTVYDYEEQNDLLVLRMDYLPGGSLADRLQKLKLEGGQVPRQMPVIDAVRVALDVAQGLAVLHGAEVVHRDVKPSNILFTADGRALVADLGLAQAPGGSSDRLVLSGDDRPWQPGTRDYMSPEQVHSKDRLTSASDIYTLGAVLFEMLTGRLYWNVKPGTTVQALRPDTPKWLSALLDRMLAEDYKLRPWNGSEVAAALRKGLAAGPERQKPSRKALWQRWPVWAGVIVGVVAVFLLLRAIGVGAPTPTPQVVERVVTVVVNPASASTFVPEATLVIADMEPPTATPEPATPTAEPPTATPEPPTVTPKPPTATAVPPTATLELPTPLPPTSTPVPPKATYIPPMATPLPIVVVVTTSPKDGMEMVYVPVGEFLMGSTADDKEAKDNEKPQHRVTLDAYWIDKTEVTNDQYGKCVGAGACAAPGGSDYYNGVKNQRPVVYVRWGDAATYCEWVGRRLPSEAEWEKAARGTDGRMYPWGNALPDGTLANMGENTTSVWSYPAGASPYGALDMAGNVWEWVEDWFAADYYADSPVANPPGPASDGYRVVRGGPSRGLRSAYRSAQDPAYRNDDLGFRCARSE